MSQHSIYSRRCWLNGKLQPATVFFENGKITSVQTGEKNNAGPDADLLLMPGVIDAHVHINEPGREDWEGFQTATAAAAAGGITLLVDMPLNSSPVTTSLAAFNEKKKSSVGKLSSQVAFYGGIIPGNAEEIIPLANAGVMGFKCFLVHSGIDEFPNVSMQDLEIAMPIIAKTGLPLLAHCEIDEVASGVDLENDPGNYKKYVMSRPGSWEKDAVDRMIALCRKTGCRVHIVHVSFAGSLESIAKAKAEGLPITAETCPHYIFFNEEEIPDANTLFKCAPPIRDRANNAELINALLNGTLDFIGSDHSPAPPALKEVNSGNLKKAWGGIAGLQFLLSASWSSLLHAMPLEKFIPLLTEHPATFLRLNNTKGKIQEGFDADFVLWDPDASFVVSEKQILHKYPISPYVGREMRGKIVRSYVAGEIAFDEAGLHPGHGHIITA